MGARLLNHTPEESVGKNVDLLRLISGLPTMLEQSKPAARRPLSPTNHLRPSGDNIQPKLDELVQLAATSCQMPIALISLIQDGDFHLVAQTGWFTRSEASSVAFDVTVYATMHPLVVEDALADPIFRALPLVSGYPHLRTYVGVPLLGERGKMLGVLSVLSSQPLAIAAHMIPLLTLIGKEVVQWLEPMSRPPTDSIKTLTFGTSQEQSLAIAASPQAIAQQNQLLRWLLKASYIIQSSLSWQEVEQQLTPCLARLFPKSSGWLLHCVSEQQTMEVVATWGDRFTTRPRQTPANCCALQQQCAYWHSSAKQCMDCWNELPVANRLCVPLMVGQQKVGILVMSGNTREVIAPEFHNFIIYAANHLAVALHNCDRLQTLSQESLLDPLTGLYNRRYMTTILSKMLRCAAYGNYVVSLIIVDIDHFKRFNDTYGHLAGDQVLKDFGILLKGFVRGTDVVCRYGGEEFILILSDVAKETAYQRAERLRQSTRYLKMKYQGQFLGTLTVSAGVATFPVDGQEANDLIQAADRALYQAKMTGRDRVELATVL